MIRLFLSTDAGPCQDIIYEHLNFYAHDLTREAQEFMKANMTVSRLIAKSREGYWLVAEHKGVCGMGVLDRGEIKHMFVAKKMHGQGIGRKILDKLELEAKKQNLQRLFLNAAKNSINFYLKAGFYIVKENSICVDNIRIDQILMGKNLNSGANT